MIIYRYLAREVLVSMIAVSIVLLLIIISARFVSYLAEAAAGKLDAGVLLTLMAYRLPAYLELILPLGLFIGILMAYGRLHMDSEMTVLSACGMSERRLLAYTLVTSSMVALVVGLFSLYLGPEGVRASESLLAEQRSRTDFETLKPARFHELESGNGISYAESISEDKKQLEQVFIAQLAQDSEEDNLTVLMAESGETLLDRRSGQKYLLLKNGRRYVGRPGEADYEIVEFEQFAQRLPDPDYAVKPKKETDGMTTLQLSLLDTPQAEAALQWRISLPILVLVVGVLAVPLSRTEPRKGRYAKMLPAVIIYIAYLVMVNAARGSMEDGKAPVPGILWWVHFAFFFLGMLLFAGRNLLNSLHRKKIALPAPGEST